ncbi:hypothetical protein [Candidatus Arsenophonus triatominarum]|uniref:hypothetical protein n=1 Tax=Candidatus Arsenophonus triatominarum TaxID=57911 RepID=UPI0007C4D96A|nr:hypothetical protein [Candidatus Arsenophonus triatominarum]
MGEIDTFNMRKNFFNNENVNADRFNETASVIKDKITISSKESIQLNNKAKLELILTSEFSNKNVSDNSIDIPQI